MRAVGVWRSVKAQRCRAELPRFPGVKVRGVGRVVAVETLGRRLRLPITTGGPETPCEWAERTDYPGATKTDARGASRQEHSVVVC